MKVTIYTDGACSCNPGVGGWSAILIYGNYHKEISGSDQDTTNNRMELMAAIAALKCLNRPCDVELYTDSTYLCDAFNKRWLFNWIRNGWLMSGNKPVKNQDLWQELLNLTQVHNVSWNKVKAHANNRYNNRCDELAKKAILDLKSSTKICTT